MPSPPSSWYQPYIKLQRQLSLATVEAEIWTALFSTVEVINPGLTGATAKSSTNPRVIYQWGHVPNDPAAEPHQKGAWLLREWHLRGWTVRFYGRGKHRPAVLEQILHHSREPLMAALNRLWLGRLVEEQGNDLCLLGEVAQDLSASLVSDEHYFVSLRSITRRYPNLSGYGAVLQAEGYPRLCFPGQDDLFPPEPELFSPVKEVELPGVPLVLQRRRPVYGAVSSFDRFQPEGEATEHPLPHTWQQNLLKIPAKSVAFYPVFARGDVHGVVGLLSPDDDFFNPYRRRVIEGVLTTLSLAVERMKGSPNGLCGRCSNAFRVEPSLPTASQNPLTKDEPPAPRGI